MQCVLDSQCVSQRYKWANGARKRVVLIKESFLFKYSTYIFTNSFQEEKIWFKSIFFKKNSLDLESGLQHVAPPPNVCIMSQLCNRHIAHEHRKLKKKYKFNYKMDNCTCLNEITEYKKDMEFFFIFCKQISSDLESGLEHVVPPMFTPNPKSNSNETNDMRTIFK